MQTKFISFKDPISSFNTNQKYSGIIAPGLLRGFDEISNVVGLTCEIEHTESGFIFLGLDTAQTNPLGIWSSRQGAIIQEDAAIPFTFDTNAGNGSYRNDVLVGRHHHDTVYPGGIGASYEVVKGLLNSDTVPTPSGNDYVILGTIRIAPGATDLSTAVFTRSRVLGLGGIPTAFLDQVNRFNNQQQWKQVSAPIAISRIDYEIAARATMGNADGGNLFVCNSTTGQLDLLPDKPLGTEIKILFTHDTTLANFVTQLVGGTGGLGVRSGYLAGKRAIIIYSTTLTDSLLVKANQIVTLIKVDVGGAFSSGTPIYGDAWKVLAISDTPARNAINESAIATMNATITAMAATLATLATQLNNVNPLRHIRWIDYIGTLSDDFDTTGLAKSDSIFVGHAICNGANSTPNLAGIVLKGYDKLDSHYALGSHEGNANNEVTLIHANLPNVDLHSSTSGYAPAYIHGTTQNGGNPTKGLSPGGQPGNGAEVTFALGGSNTPFSTEDMYYTGLPIMRVV